MEKYKLNDEMNANELLKIVSKEEYGDEYFIEKGE